MENLCTGCLCSGRNLYYIGETGFYNLYSQILNEIPVYDFSNLCVRVCWECKRLLCRFEQFKTLVKKSYEKLVQFQQTGLPCKVSLERPARLQSRHVDCFAYPDDEVKIKVEDSLRDEETVEGIKHETVHSEPEAEAFVENVQVTKVKRKRTVNKELVNGLKHEIVHREAEAEAFVQSVQVEVKKVKRKKTTKKTNNEKTKKVKSKKKLEQKKMEEDAGSASSDDMPLYICDNTEVADNVDFLDVKEETQVEKIVKKVKKTEVMKGTSVQKIKENKTKKENGVKEKEPEPEMLGGKPRCGLCGKIFSSKKTYTYHLNVLHKGQNRYPCPRCGRVYHWKSNLGRHMRTHKALDGGELECVSCDKRFASVATYRQHLRASRRHVSETDFSYECNDCGKKFVNKTRLRDHVDWEHLHNIKFRCQLCNKPFKCHTSLYVHMQNVHRNKKNENLCHICGKSYQNAAKLKYHIVAMHTSETPYRCGHCSAAFGWYSSLYRHVREVHYKMKLQPKKMRKTKRPNETQYEMPPPQLP